MSRIVPDSMTEAWMNQAKIGARRPVVRAIIQKQNMRRFEYDTAFAQGGTFDHDRHRKGRFASMIFGDNSAYREIRNIKSCSWERSVGQDAASCTITLLNTDMNAIGVARDNPESPDEIDKPGYFTFNRGDESVEENPWGFYDETGWNGIYMPDMVVKTFEGYGSDPNYSPLEDPNLVQSGTWMIDKVSYNADGTITLEMRDLARLLLDQVVFPPAVPLSEYPLTWSRIHSENIPGRDAKGGSWQDRLRRFGRASSSNDKYLGKGFTNAPYDNYVGPNGGVEGHHAHHVIIDHPRETDEEKEADLQTFWRSTGQDEQRSFVWWQYDVEDGRLPIAAIRLRMAGGPYRVYISVHNGDKWVGKRKIPWSKNGVSGSPGNVDIDAKIPFVTSTIADRFHPQEITLPRKYMAKKVRLTITRLVNTGVGEHPYRAGLREVFLYTGDTLEDLHFEKGFHLKVVGNYEDWTQVIKWTCAWAGWFWPPHETGMDFIRIQPATSQEAPAEKEWVTYQRPDPTLPRGRVWGDFMKSGTGGIADLTVDQFDKKPMMDIVNYVRDLLGFVFFIDETGGVVWRMPNLWSLGNYLSPQSIGDGRPGKRGRGGRTDEIVVIDDEETLLGYETTLDSSNIRERIFVANVVGGVGTVIKSFNPNDIGLKRTAGWSDQNFKTKRETRVMADMISARSMFTYRTSEVTIPGYPKIQIDDQIRIFERVTNETFYHYVMGIKSEIDMEEGTWTYTMQTHWLGERPEDAWVVDVDELELVTQQYLHAIGYTAHDSGDNDDTDDDGLSWAPLKFHPGKAYEWDATQPTLPPSQQTPLFDGEGPEYYDAAYEHNKFFALKGPSKWDWPYQTTLPETESRRFERWVEEYNVPFDPTARIVDYDMRGYWKSTQGKGWHPGDHFPDTFKTPYDTTFSNESKYATRNCPFYWHGDMLIDRRDNSLIFR